LRTYRDFSYDWDNYWRLPEFVKELHAKNMKYIPIMDAGVAYRPKGNNYTAFETGQDLDLFIKAPNDEIFIG
jgi:alpha-glucosidase (family GH31 glycosyl hydrolase)